MTREECPKEYFEHLVEVVRSVFAAEQNLMKKGKLNPYGMTADEYCEKVAEELISRTRKEELDGTES